MTGYSPVDEFGNGEREIRLVAIAAHARGDFEAERLALDRLAAMERAQPPAFGDTCCGNCGPGLCYVDEMTGA